MDEFVKLRESVGNMIRKEFLTWYAPQGKEQIQTRVICRNRTVPAI